MPDDKNDTEPTEPVDPRDVEITCSGGIELPPIGRIGNE